jgi:hypothetical protein
VLGPKGPREPSPRLQTRSRPLKGALVVKEVANEESDILNQRHKIPTASPAQFRSRRLRRLIVVCIPR